jgi:hypothetical protein
MGDQVKLHTTRTESGAAIHNQQPQPPRISADAHFSMLSLPDQYRLRATHGFRQMWQRSQQ